MLLNPSLLPSWLHLLLALMMCASVILASRWADWPALWRVPSRLHLLMGSVAFCVALWLLSARVGDGIRIHLLGMTSVTLLLGWRFAILSGSLALALHLLLIGAPLAALPAAWMLNVGVPVSVSRGCLALLPRRQNLFLYTLGGGFAGGMASVIAVASTSLVLLWMAGQSGLVSEALNAFPFLALLLFPEGFINGTLVTAAAVFFPGAVKTFDEHFYFGEGEDEG